MREAEHGNNVDFDDLADSAPCRSFEKKRQFTSGLRCHYARHNVSGTANSVRQ